MPASPGRSFFQIPRDEPDQGMEKPRTAQPKGPVSEEFLPQDAVGWTGWHGVGATLMQRADGITRHAVP